jgi:hypothetical protein
MLDGIRQNKESIRAEQRQKKKRTDDKERRLIVWQGQNNGVQIVPDKPRIIGVEGIEAWTLSR